MAPVTATVVTASAGTSALLRVSRTGLGPRARRRSRPAGTRRRRRSPRCRRSCRCTPCRSMPTSASTTLAIVWRGAKLRFEVDGPHRAHGKTVTKPAWRAPVTVTLSATAFASAGTPAGITNIFVVVPTAPGPGGSRIQLPPTPRVLEQAQRLGQRHHGRRQHPLRVQGDVLVGDGAPVAASRRPLRWLPSPPPRRCPCRRCTRPPRGAAGRPARR